LLITLAFEELKLCLDVATGEDMKKLARFLVKGLDTFMQGIRTWQRSFKIREWLVRGLDQRNVILKWERRNGFSISIGVGTPRTCSMRCLRCVGI
jgi:hypothetical protein